jgi:hypothetical protein
MTSMGSKLRASSRSDISGVCGNRLAEGPNDGVGYKTASDLLKLKELLGPEHIRKKSSGRDYGSYLN